MKYTRDKKLNFAAMMTDIDKDVLLKTVEKFSEFLKGFLDSMEIDYKEVILSNKENQKDLHDTYNHIREIFREDLKNDLTPEQRKDIYEKILDTGKKESENDRCNKEFLVEVFRNKYMIVGYIVLSMGLLTFSKKINILA